MFNIESILASHGINSNTSGGGGGGGIVDGVTFPTDNLVDGLIWVNSKTDEVWIYYGGEWYPLSGGMAIIPSYAGVTVSAETNTVSIPFIDYSPTSDILFVTQNTTALTMDEHYTIDRISKTIVKTNGTWGEKTRLMFTLLAPINSASSDVKIAIYEDHVLVPKGENVVQFNIPYYNPDTDFLRVYMRNTPVFKDINYTLGANGQSIDLLFSTEKEEEFHFEVQKKMRSLEKSDKDILNLHLEENATLTTKGHVQLSNAIDSVSETLASTPLAVKQAYDRGDLAFNDINDLRVQFNTFKLALTEGFKSNQFSGGFSTLDSFNVTAGYYNSPLVRMEV